MYCISHQVETIMYSTSGAQLGCTAFAIKCTAYPIMFIRGLVYFGALHLPAGVLDLPSSVLHILSCKSGASLAVLQQYTVYWCSTPSEAPDAHDDCCRLGGKCGVHPSVFPDVHFGICSTPAGKYSAPSEAPDAHDGCCRLGVSEVTQLGC